ncbi:TlpA family protein disulfide reductase [Corynebacterium uberis]|uniref:TlpA family protein disulfide reductase n=1 Tax=Corynebacterium TaxID=1716 RepID=UPI001D0B7577|nr:MULTISPECIES: TlpA disulfide reductase family protein [Corynebacterium]MCZ9309948.1 TlpA family protein disulfide reductase [Corynebacterium sp. c6VSa_13]UDL73133.1 TlpA family protein disulfide reductase [Corynebacterium uberis]UDL75990.1 TlpA family protein disulfide reductase [Corynebacterium uberis]UDL78202.1 TlpA family protein disulfide reductase [Corynebacterium uberis]UDL80485.1 TlpA family protein disulfide reductase [Corynebacterium uberis]
MAHESSDTPSQPQAESAPPAAPLPPATASASGLGSRRTRFVVIGYVCVVVVVVAVLALVVPRMLTLPDSPAATGGAPGVGSGVASQEESWDVAAQPACPGSSIAGVGLGCLGPQGVGGEASAGKVAVVNVWAWWCQPCRAELPVMEEFARQHPEWTVVGVHADVHGAAGADLLTDLGVALPSFQDPDGSFAAALGLPKVVPVTLVVRDGKVLATLPRTFASPAELEQAVRGALS